MAHADQLLNYFRSARPMHPRRRMGSEVETFFVNDNGNAISIEQSQLLLGNLAASGWLVEGKKGDMITSMRMGSSLVQYELGYPNIELSVCPYDTPDQLIGRTHDLLRDLYRAAEKCGAYPSQSPIFVQSGNYLVMPDERDATWLVLDGKAALSPLARISAVQFTIDVEVENAIPTLNRLLAHKTKFLAKYPQDQIWREYIAESKAEYLPDRYGGPERFNSLEHYCEELSKHAVVRGTELVPFGAAQLNSNESISLFLRSVWWYFRLRRYGWNLCIEVRPIPRRRDEMLKSQLEEVLAIVD